MDFNIESNAFLVFFLLHRLTDNLKPQAPPNIPIHRLRRSSQINALSSHACQNQNQKRHLRRALVFTRLHKQSHEIIVDLSTRSIVSDKDYSGNGYPSLSLNEQIVSVLPMSYKPLIESVNKRGLNMSEVVCGTFSVGLFLEEHSKRVIKNLY